MILDRLCKATSLKRSTMGLDEDRYDLNSSERSPDMSIAINGVNFINGEYMFTPNHRMHLDLSKVGSVAPQLQDSLQTSKIGDGVSVIQNSCSSNINGPGSSVVGNGYAGLGHTKSNSFLNSGYPVNCKNFYFSKRNSLKMKVLKQDITGTELFNKKTNFIKKKTKKNSDANSNNNSLV